MFGRCLILITAAVSFAACSSPRRMVDQSTAPGDLATCTGCHGDPANGNAAPPRAVQGATDTTNIAVGAHQKHLHPSSIRQPIDCSECHVVPATVFAPGHINPSTTATLTWGPLASASNVAPTIQVSPDGTTATCTNYCHGGAFTADNGALHTPSWTVVDGTQAACGTCHGIPPPSPHPSVASITECATCHPDTIAPDGTINIGSDRHINGIIDLVGGNAGCTACHGDPARTPVDLAPAPPRDTKGNTATTAPGVGAHQTHLTDGPIRAALPCASCHVVPTNLDHVTQPLNLTWSPLAQTKNVTPSFNAATATCTNYCHGGAFTADNGALHTPSWTVVDGTQAACGTCHGIPPPPSAGHPAITGDVTICGTCHPGTVKADGTIDTAGGKHINGTIDVAGGTCTSCHGDPNRTPPSIEAAPPRDTQGNTATTAPGVGAHQAHLNPGLLTGAIACSECHTVPTNVTHSTQPLNLTWGTLARTGGVSPTFDSTALTCTNYCHGATLSGGERTTPIWNAGTGQAACGACHALPPQTGQHGIPDHAGLSCVVCHGSGFSASSTNTAVHVNGVKNVGPPTVTGSSITTWVPPSGSTPGSCTPLCHGTKNW